mmetsp:Transcript_65333/g.147398  ORF Transcript_65333/g.147398 Transcript_65333/m.147398 type:complete len:394 (+) Transcript_65333:312-1493(+)
MGGLVAGQEIVEGQEHAQDPLVAHDEQRLPVPLNLVHQGLEPLNHVQVRLASRVAVAELIVTAALGLACELLGDLLVRHTVARAREDFVEVGPLPQLHLREGEPVLPHDRLAPDVPRRQNRSLERGSPEAAGNGVTRVWVALDEVVGVLRQGQGVPLPGLGQDRVPADPPLSVVLALPVPAQVEALLAAAPVVPAHVTQVLCDPPGHVAPDVVQHDLGPVVAELYVRVVGLVRPPKSCFPLDLFRVVRVSGRVVHGLVLRAEPLHTLSKVVRCRTAQRGRALGVLRGHLSLVVDGVGGNHLDEDDRDARPHRLLHLVVDFLSPVDRVVRRVEDGDPRRGAVPLAKVAGHHLQGLVVELLPLRYHLGVSFVVVSLVHVPQRLAPPLGHGEVLAV